MVPKKYIKYPKLVNDLQNFIQFISLNFNENSKNNIKELKKCASWLASHLDSIDLEKSSVLPNPGQPVVYAEWRHSPDKPTVLIYGHYDVQPADPLNEWRSPPFAPTIRGDYLYGRGASDDKGQLFIHVKAIESLLKTYGKLPVNVICLFEGEEEIGSPNLGGIYQETPSAVGRRLYRDFGHADSGCQPSRDYPFIAGRIGCGVDRLRTGTGFTFGLAGRGSQQSFAGFIPNDRWTA